MKIKKKIGAILVSSVLAVSFLMGCASPAAPVTPDAAPDAAPDAPADTASAAPSEAGFSDESAEPIHLTYWTIAGWRPVQMEYVIERFREIYPHVTVDLVVNSIDDHKRNLMIAAASDSMPSFWHNWGGTLGSFYPENYLTMDLTEYAREHNWDQKFYPRALEMATLAGQLSGAPYSLVAFGIFYNKQAFEEAGITSYPTTFEEFEDILERLSETGWIPIAAGGRNGWQVYRLLELMMEKNLGATLHTQLTVDGDTDLWLHEGVTETFRSFRRFVESGFYPEGFVTADPNDSRFLLYNDIAAMLVEGAPVEALVFADGMNPDDFGWFPFPTNGNRMTSFVQMNQFSARLTPEEFEAAMAFNHFAYSPEIIESLGGVVQQPVPRFDNTFLEALPIASASMETLDDRGGFLIVDQALPQEVVNRLFEIMDYVALGVVAPEEVGEMMQQFHNTWLLAN